MFRIAGKLLLLLILGAFMLMTGLTAPAFAHKITIVGWVEGDTVFTESSFSGGTTPKKAAVEVFDLEGNKLLDGITNDNGEFQFKAPGRMAMKIKIDAGMGHQASCTIPLDEFEDAAEDVMSESEAVPDDTAIETSLTLDEQAIRQIVSAELNKQLKPLIRRLNKTPAGESGPSLNNILSGIGYIIGLVGLGMFINYRRKVKELSP